MKKLLAMVLALVMTLSLAVSASAFKDDKDVSANYAEAVAVLNGMDVFKGYEDGSFKPQGNITRAEVATIIYRIYTGDVAKNDKSGLYSTYNKFSDMTGAGWAAGYIGYCANAELVKGYPDGTFKPSGNVTGYEVLAMILRAVGYDKNNEFSGADWSLNVAKYAEQLGILKNVDKNTNLGAPATRELVAEILFRAIQQPMVTYTPAFGYVTDKVANIAQNTLAKKNFNLDSKDSEDEWGRPSTKWYNTKTSKTYAEVTDTPVATYNVATAQCDICTALGEKTSAKIVETYTNGVKSTSPVTYKATATKAMVGAQGEQLEYYEVKDGYRLVIVDTYLAKVTEVVTEKTDKGSHITRDDYLVMSVYAPADKVASTFPETIYADGNDYAKGDYVLVNVNEAKANNVEFVGLRGEQNYVEIVSKADSLVAAQTSVRYNSNKHTIDGKDYFDAEMLAKNEAGTTKNVKYTWFFDQFGNFIGSVALDRSSFAVLKSIKWVDAGNDGYAVATLVEFDGKATEKTVTVNTIDGFEVEPGYDWESDYNDAEPFLKDSKNNWFDTDNNDDAVVAVGEDEKSSNQNYRGLAMYMVETNDDDTVNLQGIDTNKTGEVTDLYVDAASAARLNIKSSMITFDDSNNSEYADENRDYVVVTDDTQFVVRTEDSKGNFVYNAYTGTDELPNMANGTVSLMYNYDEDSKVADYVYISDYVPAELDSNLLFVYQGSYTDDDSTKDTTIYSMEVLLDGAKKTVKTSDKKLIETLAENVGKLFVVEIDTDTDNETYGEIVFLDLVNVKTEDVDSAGYTGFVAYTYLAGDVSKESTNVLMADDIGFYAKDAKVYVWNEETDENGAYEETTFDKLQNSDLKDSGVWVTADESILDRYTPVTAIYVGAKLDNKDIFDKGDKVAALSFKYTDSAAKDTTKQNTATYYFEVNEDGEFDKLKVSLGATWTVVDGSYKLTVTPVNSYIGYVEDEWLADDSGAYLTAVSTKSVNATGTATVTTEDGVGEYDLEWEVAELPDENALASITVSNNDSSDTYTTNFPNKATSLDDIASADKKALNATESFTLTATAKDPKATVKVVSVSELAKTTIETALAAQGVTSSVEVGMGTGVNGGFVVIQVTAQNGSVAYYVYTTANA